MTWEALAPRLLDLIPVGVVVWRLVGEDFILVGGNRLACTFLSIDLSTQIGRKMQDAFATSTEERRKPYREVVRTQTARDLGEISFGPETLAIHAAPLGPDLLAICFENLTQAKKRDREQRRTAAFLDAIVENIPAMVFVKDADNLRFELFNRAGEELLGVKREELLGKSDYDFFPKDQADFFTSKDRDVLDSKQLLDITQEPIDTKNGKRWLHTRKIAILDEGEARHLLGISMDITGQKSAEDALRLAHEQLTIHVEERTAALRTVEEQLMHSQKMEAVGRLAGGVAHDFNNLLSVVLSCASLVLADLEPNNPIRQDIEEIKRAGERAADLTRQLLAFSRQQVLQPRTIDFNGILSGMEKMVKRLVGEDVETTLLLSPGLWKAKADPGQIENVVLNLIVNARDAMPKGGKLTIQTKNVELDEEYAREHTGVVPGPHVMLAVSDTGTGVDKDTAKRIFEPFFTTKAKGKGTGLGLSTVFGIVNQSGGHIWVYSEVGIGTTFKLYFPRTQSEEISTPQPSPVPSAVGSETILVVEDEDAVRQIAITVLRRAGYHVLSASNPGEALLICEQQKTRIHLLLSDVILPRASGPELAERLRAGRPEMKVLFMSGYPGEAVVQHGIMDSSVAFLQKPITPDMLTRKVREVLKGGPQK
jgi:PAS domain S-box-containing protein